MKAVHEFICEICNKTFASSAPRAFYCPDCRSKANAERDSRYNDGYQSKIKKALQSAREKAEGAHKLRLQRQKAAEEEGLTYSQYIMKYRINELEEVKK